MADLAACPMALAPSMAPRAVWSGLVAILAANCGTSVSHILGSVPMLVRPPRAVPAAIPASGCPARASPWATGPATAAPALFEILAGVHNLAGQGHGFHG